MKQKRHIIAALALIVLTLNVAAQRDITATYITNASLTNGTTGWTINNFNSPSADNGYTAEAYAGWDNLAVTSYSLTQIITLPKGKYRLVNYAFFRQGLTYDINPSKSLAYLKAGTKQTAVQTLGSISADSYANTQSEAGDHLAAKMYRNVVEFSIDTDNTSIEIGIVGTFDLKQSWCITGRFELFDIGDRQRLLEALKRFEHDYNLADGTDYRRVTMSADAWATLINKVNTITTALDDESQATNYATLANELNAQMDATDASLRLFTHYKAMADGTTAIVPGASASDTDMDTDATERTAITRLNTAFVNYALLQDNPIDMAPFLGDNLDFNSPQGSALNTDNSNGIYDISGWEVAYADADTWTMLQNQHNEHRNELYMRKNWGSTATVLTVTKHSMLPEGKYTLSFSMNSDMANMTNRSQYKLGETTTAIGRATSGAQTLTYDFEVTRNPQPFDLAFGFKKEGTGNSPAQLIVDNVVLTYKQPTVTLTDAADNATMLTANAGKTCNVTLEGRTLLKDGSWNTLCLPFDTPLEGSPLAGATLMELNTEESGLDGTTLYLNFRNAETIRAGVPYIIKWTSGDHLVNPTFRAITFSANDVPCVASTDGTVTFQGTYAPATLTNKSTNFYLGTNNTLYYPAAAGFTVNAFRAYFQLAPATPVRDIRLTFGDETATFLHSPRTPFPKQGGAVGGSYTLQGHRVTNLTPRAIIIQNGKKVITH